jgi:hypothetical protein
MELSMSFRAKLLSQQYYSEAKAKNLIFLIRVKGPDTSLLSMTPLYSVEGDIRGVKRGIVFGAVRSEQCLSRVDMRGSDSYHP